VREDYSPDGNAWNFFPHDHAYSRAYRWSEDGLASRDLLLVRLGFHGDTGAGLGAHQSRWTGFVAT
jgi:hypothetical protein